MRYYLSYWIRKPGQDWEKKDQVIEAPDMDGALAQAKQKMDEAHGIDSMTALHPIDVHHPVLLPPPKRKKNSNAWKPKTYGSNHEIRTSKTSR